MKSLRAITAFALVSVPACQVLAQTAEKRPNILVILSDDQGYADAGFQGSRDIFTPNLDRLAQSGLRCTSGYVTHSYCSPSRAGLLTGRYQMRFGHERNPTFGRPNNGLPLTETLLPAYLKSAGYTTGWIGKWHLGAEEKFRPENRGFTETFGFLGGGHQYRGWKPNPNSEYLLPIERNGKPVEVNEHLTVAFGHEAAAFVKRHASTGSAQGKSAPWFLYLAFNAPHTPNQPTPQRLAMFTHIKDPVRRAYAAQISLLDDAVGETMVALRETGQDKDTLVFFLSDNGGPLSNHTSNTPLRGGKGQTYEGGVRVPFVVSWPGHLPAGKDYAGMVSSLDIFPTALALAGISMPTDKPHDGVDLIPFLSGKNQDSPHTNLFWRQVGTERRPQGSGWGARVGDLKLVWQRHCPDELYNLTSDIGEVTNVAAARAEDLSRVTSELAAWDKQGVPLAFTVGQGPDDGYHPGQAPDVPPSDAAPAVLSKPDTFPLPLPAQLAWQDAEVVAMFHMDPRIYSKQYARGSLQHVRVTDPDAFARAFNPEKLDTDQWLATAKAMGASAAILVVKHETGFCLWQSDANPYCLKMLPWRGGQGDILRDFVASCKKYGIKPGVFTETRWDCRLGIADHRPVKNAAITQAAYNRMVEGEVRELCTRYGELFELWFDGGAKTPGQDGPNLLPIAEESQPGMIFYHTDQRRDVRWGGSESGTVGDPCWSTAPIQFVRGIKPSGTSPLQHEKGKYEVMKHGQPDGDVMWCPAMADIPLRGANGRHDWMWLPGGEKGVLPMAKLKDIYMGSVGRNATLLLGLNPDKNGLVPEPDRDRCAEFGAWIKSAFGTPLATTNGVGDSLTLDLSSVAKPASYVVLQEDVRQGERVRAYVVEREENGAWIKCFSGQNIGHKRIIPLTTGSVATHYRLRVTQSTGNPQILKFAVY